MRYVHSLRGWFSETSLLSKVHDHDNVCKWKMCLQFFRNNYVVRNWISQRTFKKWPNSVRGSFHWIALVENRKQCVFPKIRLSSRFSTAEAIKIWPHPTSRRRNLPTTPKLVWRRTRAAMAAIFGLGRCQKPMDFGQMCYDWDTGIHNQEISRIYDWEITTATCWDLPHFHQSAMIIVVSNGCLNEFSRNLPQNLVGTGCQVSSQKCQPQRSQWTMWMLLDVSGNGSKFKTVCNPSVRLCDSEHKNPRCPLLHRKNTQPTYHWTDEAKDPHPQEMMQVRQETLELAMEVLHLEMAMGPSLCQRCQWHNVAHWGYNLQFFEVNVSKRVKKVCLLR